ncbi:ImmA/IrrE family metallo-endopeptidase [Anaerocellum danielii]|uniref:IrrE N-terminal-like domain-containing protein n=1 Tax=Anaerocellum danielii TaxID=1387557 RepID=A0ABZ0TZC5_9FIRM|nr:hypothetical protein [Caldicellulosiruptor danielii]WPX08832.1 hypothetical protein SOJ16_002747 [Caldicellulosiruptor danielii]
MSELITLDNLHQVIETNKLIKEEITQIVHDFNKKYEKFKKFSHEKISFSILRENHLIQIPIDDKYWGGAIIKKDKLKIPVINTAQPRVYQYFVAWHEIYHLLYDLNLNEGTHNITIDMELNERKADYFAAKMIFNNNLYEYYYSIEDDYFLNKIIKCMDVFKAPYKAVLVELFEKAALEYNDLKLQQDIVSHFDNKPNLIEKFKELELDLELIQPSYVISFGGLEKTIEEQIRCCPDETFHLDNYEFLSRLKNKIEEILGEYVP